MNSKDVTRDIGKLPGVVNFRDVALCTGARPGRLFRSGELIRLDDEGRDVLRQLGVKDVVDLRTSAEAKRRGPGLVPDGVEIHRLPIPDGAADASGNAPHEHAWRQAMKEKSDEESFADTAMRYMVEEYSRFPTYNGAQRALSLIVRRLGAGRPVLVHCFAGKDRTGLIIALVLEASGIDREAVMADYLRSNESAADLRSQVLDMIEQQSEATAFITKAQLGGASFGVREEYLTAARRTIDDSFGSLRGYLDDAGISEAEVYRLRDALLC